MLMAIKECTLFDIRKKTKHYFVLFFYLSTALAVTFSFFHFTKGVFIVYKLIFFINFYNNKLNQS